MTCKSGGRPGGGCLTEVEEGVTGRVPVRGFGGEGGQEVCLIVP